MNYVGAMKITMKNADPHSIKNAILMVISMTTSAATIYAYSNVCILKILQGVGNNEGSCENFIILYY